MCNVVWMEEACFFGVVVIYSDISFCIYAKTHLNTCTRIGLLKMCWATYYYNEYLLY